jgi:parvulin-like peptidyl-prolyl isomerase
LTAPSGEDPGDLPAPPTRSGTSGKQKSETIAASHILVAWQGARRAPAKITRTKDEARAEATRLAAQARAPGADFGALARTNSDDPGSAANGGSLGTFSHDAMTPKFADAAFALAVGQVSGAVETEFGFHVIKRTQ